MSALATDAIVLHMLDYLESSRILRIVTRDAGVQSVLARGARTSRKRFGSALDLFAEGHAELQVRPGRDLHTLISFDVRVSHASIGADLSRFTAAAAVAEAVLLIVHDEAASRVFDTIADTMTRIAAAPINAVASDAIGGLWRLLGEIGVAPTLELCAACHKPIEAERDVSFSHAAGGALCERCAGGVRSSRRLPSTARRSISNWLNNEPVDLADRATIRAHQRLLREFLVHHAGDTRPMRAYAVWERGDWAAGTEPAAAEL